MLFGNVVYYAELHVDNFRSILSGQWWAIITMTTVGYGDLFPQTHAGRVIGVFCALTGIIYIALATTVIVNNFLIATAGVDIYVHRKRRETNHPKMIEIWDTPAASEPLLSSKRKEAHVYETVVMTNNNND